LATGNLANLEAGKVKKGRKGIGEKVSLKKGEGFIGPNLTQGRFLRRKALIVRKRTSGPKKKVHYLGFFQGKGLRAFSKDRVWGV